ncbi:ubiquitin recognition factor in ER-associated degradation protein 1-like [Biomphalaria glabrata]|uniref:Ubiquitin recognition factor in ER-associated degradation protein 1-like n=1 Tax=Biomphalaria glabrata TaxID=6526 RepID=A0A9W2YF55_BIOGL|nr:ubiquitin recognition factor in ER-associated degradation protein 1-like [Biomphalaria glabrata]KAI8782860.1 ubiquitin fusion degradation protein 1 [Biomphalaria glabrata]
MFSFGNTFMDFPSSGRPFKETYKCYSVIVQGGREEVEKGGKIIMPPSALDQLTRLNIQYPMLFKLTNKKTGRETHCGVLEFVADEGRVYIPYWMMRNLNIDEGDVIQIDNVSLSIATYAKFQPQSTDFLDITNPKAVLENALRSFACLTQGDVIAIIYNEKVYDLCVLETKPGKAVSIIECDMRVDFAPPIGYVEPEQVPKRTSHFESADTETDTADDIQAFRPFGGHGNRLDGKKKGTETESSSQSQTVAPRRGIPNYNFKRGTITFLRNVKPVSNGNTEEEKAFEAFSGQGQTLKKKNRS